MTKECKQCAAQFTVDENDLAFYNKISPTFNDKKILIPAPTLCPDCRALRRLCFRNERNLYVRKCDLCKKEMVSIYSPDKKYTVYCYNCWWSDAWDPKNYGKDFDFNKPFFEQFNDLWHEVSLLGLWNSKSENAQYNNNCFELKDSYMNFNSDMGRNYYYCYITELCSDVMDCAYTYRSELCYELVDCFNCYSCSYSQKLENCSDCHFSSDLIACKNCIGCHGLRHKENYIYNKEVSPEDFQKLKAIMYRPDLATEIKKKSNDERLKTPQQNLTLKKCENCLGDHLNNCKNVFHSFDINDAENVKYVRYAPFGANNIQDGYAVGGIEWSYEVMGGGIKVGAVAFIINTSDGLRDSYYSVLCVNGSANLFGCIGINKGNYCILNKQYTKEQYEEIMPKIIEHMKKTGEWGEFFPAQLSPFGYNETLANEEVPLTKEAAIKKDLAWSDYEQPKQNVKMIKPSQIQEYIEDEEEKILGLAIECEVTGKPFKIIKPELEFYKKLKLPLPRRHPDQRYEDRILLRNPRKIFIRTCKKCAAQIQTTYAPNRPETVYCEKCYLKAVY